MKIASQSDVVINIGGKDGGANALLKHLATNARRASSNLSKVDDKSRGASSAFRKLASATSIAQGQLGAVSGRLSALSSTFGNFGIATTTAITAVIGLGAAVSKALPLAMHYEKSMRLLGYATDDAGLAFEQVKSIADKYNISLKDSVGEYAKLSAAVKGTSMEGEGALKLYEAMAVASSALGMSADDTAGSFRAFTQMLSKGNVQAEELRGQLGERLIGAFSLAAKSMGMSTKELNKALEQGLVKATDLIPKISELMLQEFGGTALEAADSLQGKVNELGNAWYGLGVSMQKAGLTDVAASILGAASDFIKDFSHSLEGVSLMFGKGNDKRAQLLFDLAEAKERLKELKEQYKDGERDGVWYLWGLPDKLASLVKGEEWAKEQARTQLGGFISQVETEIMQMERRLEKLNSEAVKKKKNNDITAIDEGQDGAAKKTKGGMLDRKLTQYKAYFDKMAMLDAEYSASKEQKEEIRYIEEWNKMDAKLSELEKLKVGKTEEEKAKIEAVMAMYYQSLESMEANHNAKMQGMYDELRQKEIDKHQEKMASIDEFVKTPLQIEADAYQAKLQSIDEYYASKRDRMLEAGMTEVEINKMIEDEKYAATLEYNKKVEALEKAANANRLSLASGFFGALGSLMQTGGKKAFEAGKKLQIASTIISTYAAAQKAFDSQIIPGDPTSPIRGGIAAASAVMQGLARVAAIKNTQFNSTSAPSAGSSATSGGSSAPAPQPVAVSGGVKLDINLNSNGQTSSADLALLAEQLAPHISSAISKGLGGVPVLP